MANFFNLESTWLGGMSTGASGAPVNDLSYNTLLLGGSLSDTSFNLALQNQIISNEQQRLSNKQQSIDLAKTSQNRMLTLNTSYSERYSATTKIVVVFVVVFAIFIGLMFLHRAFPVIPSGIMDLIYITLLSLGFIKCLMIYMNIQTRDPVYFDQINIPPPVVVDSSGSTQSTNNSGNLLGNFGTCIGSACCDTATTVWNTTDNVCEPIQMTTTTSNPPQTTQGFTTIRANYESEGELYSPY